MFTVCIHIESQGLLALFRFEKSFRPPPGVDALVHKKSGRSRDRSSC